MGYTAELEQAGKTIDRAILEAEKVREVDPEVVTAMREDMPEAIGFIRASTEKMDRLINAILKLSREGRRNLVPETLDMATMAESRRRRHPPPDRGEPDAEIVVEPMPTFESDRLSIEQIIGNLIDNAVKYLDAVAARPDRRLGPTTARRLGRVSPSPTTAAASPTSDHERIFELFRRSGRQDRPGEGLGLAFVRNSVRRLGGSIDVEVRPWRRARHSVLKFPKRLILDEAGDIQ